MDEDRATSIANYTIEETLLDSPEGIIYGAVDAQSGIRVLLKKYYPTLRWSDEILNEFFNLASYLRFIEHEYLLPVLDVGKHEGGPYVVFASESRRLLSQRPPAQTNSDEVLLFLQRLAETLDFLHKQEIIHGTLNTTNIILDLDENPRLFDYGLHGVFKKLLSENMEDGFENLSVSNLRCTSPEEILGRSPNRVSDIYSFGTVGYFYLFGELPFDGQYVPERAIAHFQHGILKTLKLPAGISSNILQFIQKCIQLNPEARFASFSQIISSLEQMRAGRRVRLKLNRRFAIQRLPFRSSVSPAYMGVAAAILGALVLYFAYPGYGRSPFAPPPMATAIASAASSLPKTPSITLPAESPTNISTPNILPTSTEAGPAYWLAFEGTKPVGLTQRISTAKFANLREISRLGHGKPEEAAVTPDGIHSAIATSAGVIILRETEFLKWLDVQGWATSVQFSPDGTTLAVGLMTGEIQLWDWQAGTQTAALTGHTKQINRILISQNGILYSASADQYIMVWSMRSGTTALPPIRAHSQPVNDIAVTSDGRTLVSCSDDKLIRVWDLATNTKLYELGSSFFTGAIKALAVSSDDAYFTAGGDSGYLYQWNLLTSPSTTNPLPKPRADIAPVQQRIWSIQYIRDDTELLVGVDDGKSVIYEAARKEYEGISLTFEILPRSLRLVDAFGSGFDFDSSTVFYGDSPLSLNWDGQVTTQDTTLLTERPMYDVLDRLDFSPDGTKLAAGGRRGSTHIWNLTTNASIYEGFYAFRPDQPLYEGVHSLPPGDPISPDGASIALVMPKTIRTSNNTITAAFYQIRSLSGAGSPQELTQSLEDARVGYASNGSIFIAANLRQSQAWDFATGNETNVNGYPYTGCWVTASANDLKDRLQINSATGIFPATDEDHVNSLCPKTYQFRSSMSAFSHDLSLLTFVNSSGMLEGYEVLAKESPWLPYRLDVQVTTLAVSPDGGLIVVGDVTGRMLFIDGKTGQLVGELPGNFGRLEAIQFSEDGQKIATAGQDGLVRIFGVVEIQ